MKRFDVGKSHGKLILIERMNGFVSAPGLAGFLLPAIQMKGQKSVIRNGNDQKERTSE
jgi:hypothetical protein